MNERSERTVGCIRLFGDLPQRVLAVCHERGWSTRWDARLAQLTLESSELAEALRGKRGDPKAEAGDVLFVLMSMTEAAGISWGDVVDAADRKCADLEVRPRYPGEQYETPNAEAQPTARSAGRLQRTVRR